MALSSAIIQTSIQAADPGLQGTLWLQITALLGTAITSWAQVPSNVVLQGITAGSAGSGVTFGKLVVRPQALPVSQATTAAGFMGINGVRMARAIGIGIANAFTAVGTYRGISTGVGVGTDTLSIVTANSVTLASTIMATATGFDFSGPLLPQFAAAYGTGIASLISLETRGTGIVTGVGGPSPASGTSISQVV